MNRLLLSILFFALSFSLFSCGSFKYPACVTKNKQQIKIRWGNVHLKTNEKDAFELKATGMVLKVENDGNQKKDIKTEYCRISGEKYCQIMEMLKKEIYKTHTLNSAIELARFVEFYNPVTSTTVRGMWNPKYNTVGSEGFREIYDSLEAIVRIAE